MTTNRYFFGNTLAAFSRTSPTGIYEDTTSGRYDSAYVSNGIRLPSGGVDYIGTMPFIDASSTTTLNLRFDIFFNGNITANVAGFYFYNSTGTLVAKWIASGVLNTGGMQFQYWDGAAFQNKGSPVPFLVDTRYTVVMNITAGVSGTLSVYKDDVLITSGSGMNAAFDNIASVRFYAPCVGDCTISQILASDSNLRDARYFQRLANGNGHYTGGTGTYTDINEVVLDDSTAIALPAVNDEKSFTHSAVTIPTGYKIDAVSVAARARVSGGIVTDGKLLLRSNTTDSLSSSLSLAGGYAPFGYYTATDPDTSAAWGQSGFNAAEFGLKGV